MNEAPWALLYELAREKLHAFNIDELPNSDTLNIDAGMNDIEQRSTRSRKSDIVFGCRYEKDQSKYESFIIHFCRAYRLSLCFRKND